MHKSGTILVLYMPYLVMYLIINIMGFSNLT